MKIENEHFEINMIPSTDYVLKGVLNKLYVLLEIKGKKVQRNEEVKQRDPLDLVLVLDRSGSMSGQKIEYAKKGVEYAVNNLKAADHVTLISYDNKIEVEFKGYPSKNRQNFIDKIHKLHSRGSTALYDAVKKGYNELTDNKGMSRKIFLFSDGLANVGIKDPELIKKLAGDIFQNNVSVSSFGIGDDFDESLMSGIAEHGRGDYHYIEDPDQIPLVIQEALEGVVNILAMDLKLTVQGINGSTIIKAFNYDSPANITIPIYREEDVLEIIFELDVLPEQLNNSTDIIKMKFEYASPDDPLKQSTMNGSQQIMLTTDENEILNENNRVMEFLTLEKVREQEATIQTHLRENDFDAAINLQKRLADELVGLNSTEDTIIDKIAIMKINILDLERNKETRNLMRSMKYTHHQAYLSSSGSGSRKYYLSRMQAKEDLEKKSE